MLRIWAANFKELLNGKEAASRLELPSSVRRELDVEGHRTGRSTQNEKGKATGADEVRLEMLEMAGEVGVKWTGRLLSVCMQEGKAPKKWRLGLKCVETRRRRERYVEEYRPERTRGEQLRGDGGPADLKTTKGQGHEHLHV